MKTVTKKKKRRCNHKLMTKEAVTLKFLRESRNLSMRRVGKLIGVSDSTISHLENGRADIRPELVMKLLNLYECTYEKYLAMCAGKIELPQSIRRECLEIIKRMDDDKLRTVKTILMTF
ncbi:hypothetical protein DOM21_15020 [Bacteriovorax stolpii]|uniref:helix-turn-helix domain-containing protein n=1 Tax=Bacteriovorax stolpii TaxID=960 RepID=UPI0011595AAB|nr:helix-turn-helix transcriptional regulator [Bacteriovorax stolpii]QDK42738.1 hypothetical protein DOM21_15020 [Bacteriovorax stolpii]